MKTQNRRSQPEAAHALLIFVLVTCGILVLYMGAYLTMASSRNLVAMRSTAWNAALPVAEAGIEEGLTQIQYSVIPTNGWTLTNGIYTRTCSQPFWTNGSYYTVTIQSTNPPVISSVGYVLAPLGNGYIRRTVQVTTKNTGGFPYGMLAKNLISISGSAYLDSFNSSNPSYSTGGRYDHSKAEANIKVATDSGANPAIKVGSGKIYGYVDTAPTGVVTYGSGGSVGDASWVNGGLTGGQSGHVSNDMNVSIPDATVPYTSGAAVVSGSYPVGGTNYTYALGNTNYYVNADFSIPGGKSMVVTGAANFYCTGKFTVSGSGFIYLAPGGTMTLYDGDTNTASSDSITISGGGIANGNCCASNFEMIGLPSCKTITYSGSAGYTGTIYGPEASVTLSGGADVSGAVVGNTITLSGGSNFHYDEALGASTNGVTKYVIASWREL
jgi:hypothetical protein